MFDDIYCEEPEVQENEKRPTDGYADIYYSLNCPRCENQSMHKVSLADVLADSGRIELDCPHCKENATHYIKAR